MRCLRCRRKVRWSLLPLWQWPFCPGFDLDACLVEASALVEEPVLWLEVSASVEDADVCRFCLGTGAVARGRDYETHAVNTVTCPRCCGTTVEAPEPGLVLHTPTESERRYAQWLSRLEDGLGP